jgi:hypothetical protein
MVRSAPRGQFRGTARPGGDAGGGSTGGRALDLVSLRDPGCKQPRPPEAKLGDQASRGIAWVREDRIEVFDSWVARESWSGG